MTHSTVAALRLAAIGLIALACWAWLVSAPHECPSGVAVLDSAGTIQCFSE